MVNAVNLDRMDDYAPRRPATIASLDARLSVWGQAAREAIGRRAEALVDGAVIYVEHVGRNTSDLKPKSVDSAAALLDPGYESLIELATGLLPLSVKQSCRLLWVDPDRLRERLAEALMPAMEAAKAEIRRRQALYRRRARLWQNDQERLDGLRIDLEAMKVPRCHSYAPQTLAKGLFERHRVDAFAPTLVSISTEIRPQIGAKVQPSNLNEWIADLALSIEAQKTRPVA
jgi:hypothetical protein